MPDQNGIQPGEAITGTASGSIRSFHRLLHLRH